MCPGHPQPQRSCGSRWITCRAEGNRLDRKLFHSSGSNRGYTLESCPRRGDRLALHRQLSPWRCQPWHQMVLCQRHCFLQPRGTGLQPPVCCTGQPSGVGERMVFGPSAVFSEVLAVVLRREQQLVGDCALDISKAAPHRRGEAEGCYLGVPYQQW